MGYNKFIRSGNNIEVYEYEKDIVVFQGARHHVADKKVVDKDAELTEMELGKRIDNTRKASLEFRRLVSSNLDDKTFPLLLTVTYKENCTDLKQAYYDHKLFVQTLRYTYAKTTKNFKYICVPEFQERGAVHFHILFWGLPAEILLPERLRGYYENVSPTLSKIWNNGFVFLKPTDGDDKLSSYLAKYMAKAFVDPRLKHQKAYASSRNVKRPYVVSNISSLWVLLDDYVGTDAVPVKENKYHTTYLGDARYRLFKIKE
jgi:hypothetical protein